MLESKLTGKIVKDEVRDLGLKGQKEKSGTPTMGGLIILISILIHRGPSILIKLYEDCCYQTLRRFLLSMTSPNGM